MSGRTRLAVVAMLGGGGIGMLLLLAFVSGACPTELPGQPCPEAGANRAIAIAAAAVTTGLLVTPVALLAEAALRRQVREGAWLRALRRGLLAAGTLAALAALRLADALSIAGILFLALLAVAIEWLSMRVMDRR